MTVGSLDGQGKISEPTSPHWEVDNDSWVITTSPDSQNVTFFRASLSQKNPKFFSVKSHPVFILLRHTLYVTLN